MKDRFDRQMEYLRISITDRCNLRCEYCMPSTGVSTIPHDEILSFEEIVGFARLAADHGMWKVRLTGGEPLVRRGVVDLVKMLAGIQGIRDLSMTTNATLLAACATALYEAGLMRINISLDAVDPQRYAALTRGGNVKEALLGIAAAEAAGLHPIKLNCVVGRSSDEEDAREVAAYAKEHGYEIRFIRRMDIACGQFHVVEGGSGGNCSECNRLRLSADGWLRPCLFNDARINIRQVGMKEALLQAVALKPECGTSSQENQMHRIGG